MATFNVHYVDAAGNKLSAVIDASSPDDASNAVRKENPGAFVTKVKRFKMIGRTLVLHHRVELISQTGEN